MIMIAPPVENFFPVMHDVTDCSNNRKTTFRWLAATVPYLIKSRLTDGYPDAWSCHKWEQTSIQISTVKVDFAHE